MRIEKLAVVAALLVSGSSMLPGCGASEVEEPEARGETNSALASANDRTAFLFFVKKGLTKTQAAGVVGNLDQESSMNPKISQIGGGPGRGIAQWSVNERWQDENAFADSQGTDPWALQTQLDFIWEELTTHPAYGLASLQKATSLSSAVEIFQDKYEICGACAAGNRMKFAQNAIDAFGDEADNVTPGDDDDTDSPSPTPAAATEGDCMVDGVFGDCISTSECGSKGGSPTPGLCPGAANIQCCTIGN